MRPVIINPNNEAFLQLDKLLKFYNVLNINETDCFIELPQDYDSDTLMKMKVKRFEHFVTGSNSSSDGVHSHVQRYCLSNGINVYDIIYNNIPRYNIYKDILHWLPIDDGITISYDEELYACRCHSSVLNFGNEANAVINAYKTQLHFYYNNPNVTPMGYGLYRRYIYFFFKIKGSITPLQNVLTLPNDTKKLIYKNIVQSTYDLFTNGFTPILLPSKVWILQDMSSFIVPYCYIGYSLTDSITRIRSWFEPYESINNMKSHYFRSEDELVYSLGIIQLFLISDVKRYNILPILPTLKDQDAAKFISLCCGEKRITMNDVHKYICK